MLFALAGTAEPAGAAAPAAPVERLAPGQVVERAIGRRERHAFRVVLGEGEFLAVTITGQGATPELRLWPPQTDGAAGMPELLKRAYPGYPPMTLVALAQHGGEARLEVFSPGGSRGRYTLRVEGRSPLPDDLVRLRAQTARFEGRRLAHADGTAAQVIEKLRAAIAGAEQIGDIGMQEEATTNLAWVQHGAGDIPAAETTLDALLRTVRGRGVVEADALYYRATLHVLEGETQEGMLLFGQALALARSVGAGPLEGAILGSLAMLYDGAGDVRTSLGYLEQALAVTAAVGDVYDEAGFRSKVGAAHMKLGRLQEARRHMALALDLWRREIPDNFMGKATAMTDLARLYRRLNDPARGLAYAEAAAALKAKITPRILMQALIEVALAQEALGRADEALETGRRAQAMLREFPPTSVQWRVPALLAKLERNRGRLDEAQNWIETAAASAEAGRASLASERLRTTYSALTDEVYDLQVDILMRRHAAAPRQGFDRAALEASERGRARSLREMLLEARITLADGVDAALIEQEKGLRAKLSAAAEALRQGRREGRRDAAEEETLRSLSTEYDTVRARIRAAHPRYAELMQAAPMTAADLQKLVEPGTAVLSFDLGRPRSYLWVVTATGFASHTLPGEGVIGPLARRLHERLSARNHVTPGTTAAQRRRAVAGADKDVAQAAARLSRILLGPVKELSDYQRLVVIPDGVLHYVPFAALPDPRSAEAAPLVARHEVLHLPSLAVAAALREHRTRAPASRAAAVFADPVFDAGDPRVRAHTAAAVRPLPASAPGQGEMPNVFSGSGQDLHVFQEGLTMDAARLPRLAYTRTLAEEVTKGLAAPLVALDFAANREAVTRGELELYRMVLFATHGILNSEYPELSGIALSMVDEGGGSRDGFLRLQDIYHLKLNAELVVLGACETGLGQEVRGEGLVGLSRGFFYAGASRVLASLWKVDEQATVELIRELYRAVEKDGLPYPAALRQAQLRLRQQPRFASPYYWAAFFLQGDR